MKHQSSQQADHRQGGARTLPPIIGLTDDERGVLDVLVAHAVEVRAWEFRLSARDLLAALGWSDVTAKSSDPTFQRSLKRIDSAVRGLTDVALVIWDQPDQRIARSWRINRQVIADTLAGRLPPAAARRRTRASAS